MRRRVNLQRGLALFVLGAAGLLIPKMANAKKPATTGMVMVVTNLTVGGDGTTTIQDGQFIVMTAVRRDNGHTVQAVINKKTKLFLEGSRVKYLVLRDALYSTPEAINQIYDDLPVTVEWGSGQYTKQVSIDPP